LPRILNIFLLLFCIYNVQAQEIVWQKTLGGINHDWCSFIKEGKENNYLVAGYTYNNTGDITDTNNGASDIWLVSLKKENGSIQWQKTLGGDGTDYISQIFETHDGGYLLLGNSTSDSNGDKTDVFYGGWDDIWIVKLDTNLNIEWDLTYGGAGTDRVANAVVTNQGYLIASGSDSPISGSKTAALKGESDIWLLMLDFDGNEIWQKTLGGTQDDIPSQIMKTNDGNFIIAASSNSSISQDKSEDVLNDNGTSDFWIIKINSLGEIIWDHVYGGTHGDISSNIIQSSDGNFVVSGTSNSQINFDKSEAPICNSIDIWILKITTDGTVIWDKTLGGNDTESATALFENSSGNIVISGDTYSDPLGYVSEPSNGDSDYWLTIISQNGEFIRDKRFGGSGLDRNLGTIQDSQSNYIQIGWSDSNISGDKTESNYSRDWWILKFNLSDTINDIETPRLITLSGCLNSDLKLESSTGSRYEWTGPKGFFSTIQNPTLTNINAEKTGSYRVKVYSENNCFTEEIVNIQLLENCEENISDMSYTFPKFFTPNNDGYNDLWTPVSSQSQIIEKVNIFNRFGKLVKSLNENDSWDGTYNGRMLPSTDYWFKATFTDNTFKTGHFTLKK